MSDTPRTDAAASDGWSGDAVCVPCELAQDLERDNTRLRAALHKIANEPFGPAETSAYVVIDMITELARETLTHSADAKHE